MFSHQKPPFRSPNHYQLHSWSSTPPPHRQPHFLPATPQQASQLRAHLRSLPPRPRRRRPASPSPARAHTNVEVSTAAATRAVHWYVRVGGVCGTKRGMECHGHICKYKPGKGFVLGHSCTALARLSTCVAARFDSMSERIRFVSGVSE